MFNHDGPSNAAIETKLQENESCFSKKDHFEESFDDEPEYKHKVDAIVFQHKKSAHKGIKYYCKECGKQASTKFNLNLHVQASHEGIKYPCPECQYQATSKRASYHAQKSSS